MSASWALPQSRCTNRLKSLYVIPSRAAGRDPVSEAISKMVASWFRWRSCGNVLVSVTQWQRRTCRRSSASRRGLSVSLSSRPYSLASDPLMN